MNVVTDHSKRISNGYFHEHAAFISLLLYDYFIFTINCKWDAAKFKKVFEIIIEYKFKFIRTWFVDLLVM